MNDKSELSKAKPKLSKPHIYNIMIIEIEYYNINLKPLSYYIIIYTVPAITIIFFFFIDLKPENYCWGICGEELSLKPCGHPSGNSDNGRCLHSGHVLCLRTTTAPHNALLLHFLSETIDVFSRFIETSFK